MVIGEAPSYDDLRKGHVFSGYSGDEFARLLNEAGITRTQTYSTYLVKTKVPGDSLEAWVATKKKDITSDHTMFRDKFVIPAFVESVNLLKKEIANVQPNVIITLGNVVTWALTGNWGVTSWRGSMLQTDLDCGIGYFPKVLPTFVSGMMYRKPEWLPLMKTDLRRAVMMSASRELIVPNNHYIIRPTYSTVNGILTQLYDQLEAARVAGQGTKLRLGVDLETRSGHIACCGIAWSNTEALCIPFMCVERPEGYFNFEEELQVLAMLEKVLTHPNVEVLGQNFSYDLQYFWRWFMFRPRVARDTMLMQHTMFPNMQKSLDYLSSMYCPFHRYWKDDGKEWNPSIPEDEYWNYNCDDATKTFELDNILNGENGQPGMVDKMRVRAPSDFQNKLIWAVDLTMTRGVRVDLAARQKFTSELITVIQELESWIHQAVGYDLNISSPKQMADLFYEQLRFKPVKNRKTGGVTTDDEALSKISAKEPLVRGLVERIQALRSCRVFLSTFLEASLDSDQRLRCSYNIAGTETFRFASRKNAFGTGLNLQNVPAGGEAAAGVMLPNIKQTMIPDIGMEFFDIDLNSADLRIVVWESDETEMKAILAAGLDPYTEVAKEYYRDPTITKKDPRRQKFKAFCHGTHYLGTPAGLADRVGLTVLESERTQKWYFERFPRIKKWQDDLRDQIFKRRMIQNVFGYKFHIIKKIEGTVLNELAAWIPQSTVGCLINRAYVNVHENLPQVQVLLQVHDSLAGQYPIAGAEQHRADIIAQSQIVLPYADPLIIPVGIKTSTKSWGDCE